MWLKQNYLIRSITESSKVTLTQCIYAYINLPYWVHIKKCCNLAISQHSRMEPLIINHIFN